MRIPVLIGVVAVLAAGVLGTPSTRAGCASAVYVEGYLQFGTTARGYDLTPGDGTVAAVFPACNDGGGSEPDRQGTVTRLKGVSPTVAVRDGSTVFIGQGQMTALADHPLHTETPKRRNCRPGPTVSRKAVAELGYTVIGRGRKTVQIDAQTRLTNYSRTTPVVTGQRFTRQHRGADAATSPTSSPSFARSSSPSAMSPTTGVPSRGFRRGLASSFSSG